MADFLDIFVALEQEDSETISCTILDSNNDVILLAAVACFMRRRLNRVHGYFKVTIPAYLLEENRQLVDARNNAHRTNSN
jgi:hypothetical protein